MKDQPYVDTSPKVSDEIRKTTCYMCACRCGINVHLKDGQVAYIEGNRDHPVNQGVLCAKGSAGIMQVNAPSRLRAPLKRVGPRGSGEFEEISWEDALSLAVSWLKPIRDENPEKLAFFTGRDQSQSFTSFWAQNFGTPNYAAHGGFCSVNMAAAGIYTMGGAFWEFGQPDWDHTKLFMIFGVAEDHDSNPIKMGIGKIKARGAKIIGVNPIRTGYNAVADEWVGITPGTDGLFILSLIHELLKAGKIDLHYLAQYTNAPVLIDAETGLLMRDKEGKLLVMDRLKGEPVPFDQSGVKPDLNGILQRDGKTHHTVFHAMVHRYLSTDYAPEAVSDRVGIPAGRIRAIAAELARVAFEEAFEIDQEWTDFRGEVHSKMTARPVSMHAMRGISAHSNGFQTCRALHVLQILLGTVEVPGGFRFKPPYPKPAEVHPKPHCKVTPGAPLDGPHLGFVHGPDDLALKTDGTPARIDKAFSWENPMSAHGLMHMVISNAYAGDPYKIDTLFMYMANMSWNSSMNTKGVIDMLTDKDESGEYVIPRIIYSDAYSSEMVAYADLVLPDTTYLERHDCISLLDRPICFAARYYKPWNAAYQDWAVAMGLYDSPQPYLFNLYVEPMRKFQRAAEGHGERQPPEHLRARIKETLDPLPIWYPPFEEGAVEKDLFPLHALTQRPMAMYHSWGTQNAWLRQIHGLNPLYLPSKQMREHGLKDGDWAKVTSAHGNIVVPVAEMAALNENTVWTWNAIGKRKGAWALDENAPEATKGFLLNHLIHELQPPKGDGLRWANSDPVTGQAAWFDLRVRIEKVPPPKGSQPNFAALKSPVGKGPSELKWKVGS
ncbi:MAG: formate dehydrogenase [Rhodobacteraceae bacterium]|nr:formate dehydrogenase [Paracoccaceae bacterium]